MPRPGGVYARTGRPGWWASLTTHCGKRVQVNLGRTKSEAQRKYGRYLDLRDRGEFTLERLDEFRRGRRYTDKGSGVRTLATAFADFEAAKASKKSLPKDRERWGVLMTYLPPSTVLRTLTVRQVDDALNRVIRDRGLSEASRNRYAALLRSVLMIQKRRKVRLGLDPSDVRTTKESPRDRVFESWELDLLFEHIAARIEETTNTRRRLWLRELEVATRLGLMTGARIGELSAATWRDCDLRGGSIRFRQTKAGGARTVPLSKAAVALLKAWRDELGKPGRDDRVFVSKADNVGRRFGVEAAEAGILDARFHDLRRTAASRMMDRGMDPRVVQSVTGHADLTVLLRVYHRASDVRRREAVAVLDEAFGGGS